MAHEQELNQTESGSRGGLAAVGVAALMVGCCASAPLVVGLLGGIAATTLLGAGAAVAGALALTAAGVLIVRSRRRRACEVPTPGLGQPRIEGVSR